MVIHQLYCYSQHTVAAVLLLQSVYRRTLLLQSMYCDCCTTATIKVLQLLCHCYKAVYCRALLYCCYNQCTAAVILLLQPVHCSCCITATTSVLQLLYYCYNQCTAAAVLLQQPVHCSCCITATTSALQLLYYCYNQCTAAAVLLQLQCTGCSSNTTAAVHWLLQ